MRSIAIEPISEERQRIKCQSRLSAQQVIEPVAIRQLEGTVPPAELATIDDDVTTDKMIGEPDRSCKKDFRTRNASCRRRVSLRLFTCVDAGMAVYAHGLGVHTT